MDMFNNNFMYLIITIYSINIIYTQSLVPGIHKCQQGYKCVYYRGGKLLNTINDPGYHFTTPIITSHHNIQVTWQTDKLKNVLCGSSQGGKAFLDIEVVNKLSNDKDCIIKTIGEHSIEYDKPIIFDYIPSEVAQFCKNYSLHEIVIKQFDKLDEVLLKKLIDNVKSYNLDDCISIKNVRISRPKLDDEMREKFEAIEYEQKQKELAIQKKETEKINLEIELQREIMEKERQQKTSEIEMNIQKLKIKFQAERQLIIDDMEFLKNKKKADAEKYKLQKIAEGNELLFANPNYIILEGYKAAHNNAKLVIGEVPQNALMNLGGFTSVDPNIYRYFSRNNSL